MYRVLVEGGRCAWVACKGIVIERLRNRAYVVDDLKRFSGTAAEIYLGSLSKRNVQQPNSRTLLLDAN
jgi:hypothetical protein